MNIYKINHLIDENTIDKIHVFYGQHQEDLNSLFKNDPTNVLFQDIFQTNELENIQKNQTSVIFSQQQIHMDDSIGMIKLKIFHEFSETFSIEEIYLFCMKEELLNSVSVYQLLTQNKKIPLSSTILKHFLLNIIKNENGENVQFNLPNKSIYEYDDILSLNLEGKKWQLNKILGQKFFILNNEYPIVYNPFIITKDDSIIKRKHLTTLNSHLLLNAGKIIQNNIYLCLAKNVLTKIEMKNTIGNIGNIGNIDNIGKIKKTIEIYYPFLDEEKIYNLQELEEKKEVLIEKNNKKMKSSLEMFQEVDLFYNVYKKRTKELNYKNNGIKSIKFMIHSLYKLKIPLLTIFKLLHVSEQIPFIKYNPSLKQEKWLRLYSNKMSIDGRKIPFLPKETIIRLLKTIGKTKSVCVFIKELNGVCEFEENGNIIISAEFHTLMNLNEINDLLIRTLNPVIEEIKYYLEQNGYAIALFKNLEDENVEIRQMNYQTIIGIEHLIKFNDIKRCMSSIFITESSNIKKSNYILRLKRVANFNKLNSIEAFVIEKQKDRLQASEIIVELLENYKDLKQDDAIEILRKMASELQVERGVRKNDIEIKINPGFKTTIQIVPNTSDISIQVENINDIYYLDTIPIYLDSLIRLTQDKKSTNISSKQIKDVCSGNEKKEDDVIIEDIIMSIEDSFLPEEKDVVFNEEIEEEEYEEEEDEKVKNALSMFFGDDDEEDEEEEEREEEKSIPSFEED